MSRVQISRPEKVLFPADGITKADLAAYYERVAQWMVPHVRGRPVSMQRFPVGIERGGFFHKNVPNDFPVWIGRVEVPKEGGSLTHAIANNADSLVYLVGQGTITPHVWLSRSDDLDHPDRLVFDLDPSDTNFARVRSVARELGELLRELGLSPFPMVTGSKGIHLWVPLRRSAGVGEVRAFAEDVGHVMAEQRPDDATMAFRKAKRGGRILIDVARNGYAQTAVPPYAVRPRPGAPVATPIRWEELSDSKLRPDRWNIRNVFRRLSANGDPWAGMGRRAAGIAAARRKLERRVAG